MKKLLALLLFPMLAVGQSTVGYHRIGQVLARAPGGVNAQVSPYAKIIVTSTATGLAGVIYSNPGLSAPVPSSTVTADANGNYGYYFNLNLCMTEKITYPNGGSIILVNVCSNGGSGSATVQSFSAPSSGWPSWLVPTVTSPTVNPSLTVAAGPIPLTGLASQSNDTVVMNATGSSAVPTAVSLPTGCSSGVNYSTSTHLWSCTTGGTGTVTTSGTIVVGSLALFTGNTSIASANLTGDATTSGSASVTVVGTNGAPLPASATAVGTNSSKQIVSASVQGSDTTLLTSGTVSGSTGLLFCTDLNHGATTSGCPSPLTNPMTTTGDIITGGTSGAPQRLGIGTTSQVLTVVGGVPAWSSSPAGQLSGGALGSAPYQSAVNTTTFIASPTTSGHTFVYGWTPSGSIIAPVAIDLGTYIGTNVTGTSPIVATPSTLGVALSCPSCGSSSGGTAVTVNGGGSLGSLNLNATAPVADSGYFALTPKISGANVIIESPIGTSSVVGLLQTDGSTISNSSGVISCTTATSGQIGCLKVDGTILTISAGAATVAKGTSSGFGVLECGSGTSCSAGVISVTGGGGSGLTGQTAGYGVEAATATTATGPFPMDDAVTLTGYITAHKNFQVIGSGTANGFLVPSSGGLPSPTAGDLGIFADTSGNGYESDAGGTFYRFCTSGNGQCGSNITNVTITTGTGAVSATCASNSLSSSVTMTGVATTNTLTFTPTTDLSSVGGWDTGALYFVPVLAAGSFQWRLCTGNSGGTTPGGSVTWNVSAR